MADVRHAVVATLLADRPDTYWNRRRAASATLRIRFPKCVPYRLCG